MNLIKNITRARKLLHELKLRRLRTFAVADIPIFSASRCDCCGGAFGRMPDESFRSGTCDRCIVLKAHACVEEIVDSVIADGPQEETRPAVRRRNRR